jgi:methylmalonyl-CoA mutase, N-terminal domain
VLGGTLSAIEAGYIQRQIQDSAYKAQVAIDEGSAIVVGVNRFATEDGGEIDVFQVDRALEAEQVAHVRELRARRDASVWQAGLAAVESAARSTDNLVPPIIAAVEARATVGEIADTMRAVFGEHEEVTLD